MIRKPTIIITSLGRTGTQFFAVLFRDLLPNATSLHEPDVFNFFQYESAGERIRQTVRQIREVGFYNLFVRKALSSGSLIALSDLRVEGQLEYHEGAKQLLRQRRRFVSSRKGDAYVESNAGYYGLIDISKEVFEHHRIAYIVRDGQSWVRSKMNWGQMYNKSRIRGLLAHTWPTAAEIEGDPYAQEWPAMSRFEKICWAWARLNEYALSTLERNPGARVIRFEEIFESSNRYLHLADLVNFAAELPGVEPVPAEALEGWLDQKIHGSRGNFPAWSDWSPRQKQQFSQICGPLMEELRYEFD